MLRRFDEIPEAAPSGLAVGALSLDPASGRARLGADEVVLTGAEQRILEILMRTAGWSRATRSACTPWAACPTAMIAASTHISSLRRKLRLDSGGAPAIRNLRGLGYVLAAA